MGREAVGGAEADEEGMGGGMEAGKDAGRAVGEWSLRYKDCTDESFPSFPLPLSCFLRIASYRVT